MWVATAIVLLALMAVLTLLVLRARRVRRPPPSAPSAHPYSDERWHEAGSAGGPLDRHWGPGP